MQIEVIEPTAPLRGGREVWVRVLSNEVLDWPTVYRSLSEEQREMFDGVRNFAGFPAVAQFFPHLVTKDEKEDHGYSLEDWFVFENTKPLAESAL